MSQTTATSDGLLRNAAEAGPDPIDEVPSPSRRVWLGLCVILATFVFFAWYMTARIQRLEAFQRNVVQRNRKSSLQLLRLQNDTYLLAISIRDMALARGTGYPLQDWKPVFTRLRDDMEDAVRLDGQFAPPNAQTDGLRRLLRADLGGLSLTADRIFTLARAGRATQARAMVRNELENKRAAITALAARLLVTNDQTQADAASKIKGIYATARSDILLASGLLFLLAVATGLYVLQASRRAFEKLRYLAEQLRGQSNQLRDLSWRLIDLQEQTLRRIAVDLHDEFGQILTAVGLLLKRCEGEEDESERRENLETAGSIVRDTLEKVRDQSQMLHPAILEDFGLEQSLEWLVHQFSRQTGISVEFQNEASGSDIPAEDVIHLYRIVQEALNNVARHARATRAWVALREEGEDLMIETGDNGIGFEDRSAGDGPRGKNLGFIGMRERAEHLKGSLTINASPGRGTIVQLRVRLARAAAT